MRNDQNSISLDDIDADDHKLTVEIKNNKQEAPDNNEVIGLALIIIEGLIKEQLKTDMIQGVYDYDGLVRTSDWVEVEEWTRPLKVIRRQKSITVKLIVALKMTRTIIQLYES